MLKPVVLQLMMLMFFYLIKLSPKRLSKNHIRDSMLTQNMYHLMKMIFLSHLSMLLISDGKLILVNIKSIINFMESIVTSLCSHRPKLLILMMINLLLKLKLKDSFLINW